MGFGRPSGGNTLTTNRVCMGMTIGKLEIKRGSNDSILNSSRPGKNGESCMFQLSEPLLGHGDKISCNLALLDDFTDW